jgi:hypothetical protein
MPYFADLTTYGFLGPWTIVLDPATRTYNRISHQGLKVLRVGWLDPGHPFSTTKAESALLQKLERFYEYRVNQTRGVHICLLCPESKRKAKGPDANSATILRRKITLGSAEIRVPGRPGIVYACPDLVYHYISDHDYHPPDQFIEAVMSMNSEITIGTLLGRKDIES